VGSPDGRTFAGRQENRIMTTEAANVQAQPDPDTSVLPGRNPKQPTHRARPLRSGAPTPKDAQLLRDDPPVTDLVTRATGGDRQAWDALVDRYAPLIWSICRTYRLGRADADDVGQNVWLHLVDHLDKIREPAALPGWLATTTRRECSRVLRAARGPHAVACTLDAQDIPDEQAETADQDLLAAERQAALRQAFTHLPPAWQQLIAMLTADPPVPYAEISARLGIPVGSIGPTRRRCLDKMRRHPAISALTDADSGSPRPVMAAAS
jgi:RNA polymerase sigma factor (sigma-70 family)